MLETFLNLKKKRNKPVIVGNFWINSYIESKINGDRN